MTAHNARQSRWIAGLLSPVLALASALAVPATALAAGPDDSFYLASGTDLAALDPGDVINTRTLKYHVAGVEVPLDVTQIVYRSTDMLGRPSPGVTSVINPPVPANGDVLSYQSFYDSLNPEDSPSRIIAGGLTLGGLIPTIETALLAPFLLQGYTVNVPDTQGQYANFAAAPEYGMQTLDSLRATLATDSLGVSEDPQIGLFGYSGGAIATGWASQLAPGYAPEINSLLIGAAEGGVMVNPASNLNYINGTPVWAGVAGMAIDGVARSFEIDFSKYLNPYGQLVLDSLQSASILNALGQRPGFSWQLAVKPEYADPASVPEFVWAVNQINMGLAPSPTVPLYIAQGAGGELEGTPGNKPGIGPGDGVMITGDVRALARQFCADGTDVQYHQFDELSHFMTSVAMLPEAIAWLAGRFAGVPAPSNCGAIAPGNSLAPVVPVAAG